MWLTSEFIVGCLIVVENDENNGHRHIFLVCNILSGIREDFRTTIIYGSGIVSYGHHVMTTFSGPPTDPDCEVVDVVMYINFYDQVVALWENELCRDRFCT